MKRVILSIFSVALMGIVMNPLVSFAQEEELLIAISEDEALSGEERFEKAKAGLEKALSLALDKVSQLTADLNNRQFDEETIEAELRVLYLEDLAQYGAYYSEALTAAQTLESLESVQALAQEVKGYRDTTYTAGVEKIVEFILVFYSEDVIGTATERFEKITEDIDKLETLGLIGVGVFSEEMDSINALLMDAAQFRMQAKDMLLVNVEATSTDEVPVETVDIAEDTATSVDELPVDEGQTANEEKTPKALLETSLNNVKSAYELFVQISNSVKETLGLE